MVATYLPIESQLKVNYVSKEELLEEEQCKSVPSLRDFEFLKVLGTGGFATVYMVRKRTTGALYAMKLVKKEGVKQDSAKFAQVYTERQILEQLKNPFLVQLHYAFVTKNFYCLVIDLCTGGELFYYLQKHQSFQLANARLLFAEVVLAIEFLHKHHILYRDLKPENVLVDERGHLRLTDFGLCRGGFVQRRDRAMSFVGSPEYMSPEILMGRGYDYSVDFYTLGVLLYEMLVGLPPHYNEDKVQMYQDITMKEPFIPPVLQGDARNILERLLQIDPRHRLGMGPTGIQEIKSHAFFKEIDWEALQSKAQQPGRKRLPIEVNILDSNFDRQYTALPIKIDVAQEELIQINEPIQLKTQVRLRSKSFTWKPHVRSKSQRARRRSSAMKKARPNRLHHQQSSHTSKLQRGMTQVDRKNGTLGQLKTLTQKTNSQHIKRTTFKQQMAGEAQHIDDHLMQRSEDGGEVWDPALVNFEQDQQRTLLRQAQSNMQLVNSAVARPASSCLRPNSTSIAFHNHQLDRKLQSITRLKEAPSQTALQGTNTACVPFPTSGVSTVEVQSSMQVSENGAFKNSQSALDVFTELSLVTEEDGCTTNMHDRSLKDVSIVKAKTSIGLKKAIAKPSTNMPQYDTAQSKKKNQRPPFEDALSPLTQYESKQGHHKAGLTHHGYSEYDRRGLVKTSKETNQESAFNYRKQTLGEEEMTLQDQNSCTEVDLAHFKSDQKLNSGAGAQEDKREVQMQFVMSDNSDTGALKMTPNLASGERHLLQQYPDVPSFDQTPLQKTPRDPASNGEAFLSASSPYQLGKQGQGKMHHNSKPSLYVDSSEALQRVTDEMVLEEQDAGEYLMKKKLPKSVRPAGIPKQPTDFYRECFSNTDVKFAQARVFTPTDDTRQDAVLVEEQKIVVEQNPIDLTAKKLSEDCRTPNVQIQVDQSSTPRQCNQSQPQTNVSSFHAYASFTGQVVPMAVEQSLKGQPLALPSRYGNNVIESEGFETDSVSSSQISQDDSDKSEDFLAAASLDYEDSLQSDPEGAEMGSVSASGLVGYIDQSKLQVMHQKKSIKLKKRLSQRNLLTSTNQVLQPDAAVVNSNRKIVGPATAAVLQQEYGFSVEAQRQGGPVVTFNQSSMLRNVAKHQSSQDISNLIAQSVKGITPRVFSKVASSERLPQIPESQPPFDASKIKSIQVAPIAGLIDATPSNMSSAKQQMEKHQKLIKFTEKAAGVVSERNRKFNKPQTLKSLEQKLLEATDDEQEVEEFCLEDEHLQQLLFDDSSQQDGPGYHQPSNLEEVYKLELPTEDHEADKQLHFSSEMISIDESYSRVDEEPEKFAAVVCEDMAVGNQEDTSSPILQFQSQSMTDLSPDLRQNYCQTKAGNGSNSIDHESTEQLEPMRESLSSPSIIKSSKPYSNAATTKAPKQSFRLSRNKESTTFANPIPQSATTAALRDRAIFAKTKTHDRLVKGYSMGGGGPQRLGSTSPTAKTVMSKKSSNQAYSDKHLINTGGGSGSMRMMPQRAYMTSQVINRKMDYYTPKQGGLDGQDGFVGQNGAFYPAVHAHRLLDMTASQQARPGKVSANKTFAVPTRSSQGPQATANMSQLGGGGGASRRAAKLKRMSMIGQVPSPYTSSKTTAQQRKKGAAQGGKQQFQDDGSSLKVGRSSRKASKASTNLSASHTGTTNGQRDVGQTQSHITGVHYSEQGVTYKLLRSSSLKKSQLKTQSSLATAKKANKQDTMTKSRQSLTRLISYPTSSSKLKTKTSVNTASKPLHTAASLGSQSKLGGTMIPRQPTLMTSPMQKMVSCDQNSLSLRVLKTPFNGIQGHQQMLKSGSLSSTGKNITGTIGLPMTFSANAHDCLLRDPQARRPPLATGTAQTVAPLQALVGTTSADKRLATVSSRRSFQSQSCLSQQNAPGSATVVSGEAGKVRAGSEVPFPGDKLNGSHFPVFQQKNLSPAMQTGKDAYKKWQEAPMMAVLDSVSNEDKPIDDPILSKSDPFNQATLPRSYSDVKSGHTRRSFNKYTTSPQHILGIKAGHGVVKPSLFEVTEFGGGLKQGPTYGGTSTGRLAASTTSKSPDQRKKLKKKTAVNILGNLLQSSNLKGAAKCATPAHKTLSLTQHEFSVGGNNPLREPKSCKKSNRKSAINVFKSTQDLASTGTKKSQFGGATKQGKGRGEHKRTEVVEEEELSDSVVQEQPEMGRKDYTEQLVPVDPVESSQLILATQIDYDEVSEDKVAFDTLQSQGGENSKPISNLLQLPADQRTLNKTGTHHQQYASISTVGLHESQMMLSRDNNLTPRALAMNKQKTPFKHRFMMFPGIGSHCINNETSVEVLKLDASEFNCSGDHEATKSNLQTLRSEEFLGAAACLQRNQNYNQQLNSTFQYVTVSGGETQCDQEGRVLSADGVKQQARDRQQDLDGTGEGTVLANQFEDSKDAIIVQEENSRDLLHKNVLSFEGGVSDSNEDGTMRQFFNVASDYYYNELRRGSAKVPDTSGPLLLSAQSITSFGQIESQNPAAKQQLHELVMSITSSNRSCNSSHQRSSNQMPIGKHPQHTSASQSAASFVSAMAAFSSGGGAGGSSQLTHLSTTGVVAVADSLSRSAYAPPTALRVSKKSNKAGAGHGSKSTFNGSNSAKAKPQANKSQSSVSVACDSLLSPMSSDARIKLPHALAPTKKPTSQTNHSGKRSVGANHPYSKNVNKTGGGGSKKQDRIGRKPKSPTAITSSAMLSMFPKKVSLDLHRGTEPTGRNKIAPDSSLKKPVASQELSRLVRSANSQHFTMMTVKSDTTSQSRAVIMPVSPPRQTSPQSTKGSTAVRKLNLEAPIPQLKDTVEADISLSTQQQLLRAAKSAASKPQSP